MSKFHAWLGALRNTRFVMLIGRHQNPENSPDLDEFPLKTFKYCTYVQLCGDVTSRNRTQ